MKPAAFKVIITMSRPFPTAGSRRGAMEATTVWGQDEDECKRRQ